MLLRQTRSITRPPEQNTPRRRPAKRPMRNRPRLGSIGWSGRGPSRRWRGKNNNPSCPSHSRFTGETPVVRNSIRKLNSRPAPELRVRAQVVVEPIGIEKIAVEAPLAESGGNVEHLVEVIP